MLAAIVAAMRKLASAAATGLHWCWWAIDWTIHAPFRLLGGGGSGGSVPHPFYQSPAQDPTAEIAKTIAARGRTRALKGALPDDLSPSVAGTDPVSKAVHGFASALPSERDRVSLAALSPDQQAWLLRQSADDLARMAAAGGLVCGRLATGKAGGALGVQPCRRREPEPETDEPDLTDRGPVRLDYAPSFSARVDAMRPMPRRRRAAKPAGGLTSTEEYGSTVLLRASLRGGAT